MDAFLIDRDTALTRVDDNTYAATVSGDWNALGGAPNGGYLLSLCLQALRDQVPAPDPLVMSGFFLRPAAPGPAELHVELIRRGRQVATGEARLKQSGKEVVRTIATFNHLDRAAGPAATVAVPPRLPAPDASIDLVGDVAIPGVTIVDRFDYRVAELPGWRRGEPTGRPEAEFWLRFSDGRPPDVWSLPLLVDAAAPAVLEVGAVGSVTLELTLHVRAKPAPGWAACRATTRHIRNGYHEEDFELWDSTGTLVAQSRQLAALVAP